MSWAADGGAEPASIDRASSERKIDQRTDTRVEETDGPGPAGAASVAVVGLILVVSSYLWDGAFDMRYWALAGVLVLVALAAILIPGGASRIRSRPLLVAVLALWSLALWCLVSGAWAPSPGRAFEGAARTALYAALFTLPIAGLTRRRDCRIVAGGLLAAVSLAAGFTLLNLYSDGVGSFLAGRLDDPIGYRNGTASLFALATWPLLCIAAARGPNPALRAGALAVAVLMLDLSLLTQSRGVLIGLAAGGLVSVAIGPDRVRRCWLGIAAAGIVAAASGQLLTPYDAYDGGAGVVTDDHVRSAANAVLLGSAVAFVGGLFVAIFDNGLRRGSAATNERLHKVSIAALAGVAVVAAIGVLVAIGNPVSYADEKLDEFTDVEASTTEGSTRLGSVGGQRYDLWRIAADEFAAHPLQGSGEGGYSFVYYRERETDRNLSDPHSLPIRLLSETGLIGLGLFCAFLVAAGIAIARSAAAAGRTDRAWIAGMAAAGTTVLAQTLTDWIWLLPGLLGLAFLALGLASAGHRNGEQDDGDATEAERSMGWKRPSLYAGIAIGAAAVLMGLVYSADVHVRVAQKEGADDPQVRLDSARTAEALNPFAVRPLYLQASAHEDQGDVEDARDALNAALDLEPENFVTLGLLGDLEVRAGNEAQARRYYAEALELNPRDVGLQDLAEGEVAG